jgi:HSP20 family protein
MKDKTADLTATEPKKLEPANSEPLVSPFFVEAETMFDRLEEISRETAQRAFDFFVARGGHFGMDSDDWFRAERELLRFVPVEITDSDRNVNIKAFIAGFKPEDVEISVKENMLLISGETEERSEKKDENVIYSDFNSNRFFRQLTLPTPVDPKNTRAEMKDGMLTISLPKADVAEEPKRIAVTAA